MDNLLGSLFSVALYAGALRIATPLLLAAIGEMVTERSGVLNLGIEGQMTFGAFISFFATDLTGSLWIGLVAAIIGGALAGLLMAFGFEVHFRQRLAQQYSQSKRSTS